MLTEIQMVATPAIDRVPAAPPAFTIELTDCIESVGVGLVSSVRARRLLPPEFALPIDGQPLTPLVVLAMRCQGIAIDDNTARPGIIVQVGLVIAPPDGTGDVNSFTLWHFTTHSPLARRLRDAGLSVQLVPTIAYDVALGGKLHSTQVTVPAPAQPAFDLCGSISEPSQPLSLTGNWWAKGSKGLVKQASQVPAGLVGEAQLTLTTAADSPLGQLIDGASFSFPVLQRFNTFAQAQTQVSLVSIK